MVCNIFRFKGRDEKLCLEVLVKQFVSIVQNRSIPIWFVELRLFTIIYRLVKFHVQLLVSIFDSDSHNLGYSEGKL